MWFKNSYLSKMHVKSGLHRVGLTLYVWKWPFQLFAVIAEAGTFF